MKTLTASSTDLRNFHLLDGNTDLGKLFYEKWYSFNATINVENQEYQCQFNNFWGTELRLLKNGELIGTFKINWLGKIVVEFNQKKYLLTSKGFLKYRYVLLDESEKEIVAFLPDFNMKKFRYDYSVEMSQQLDVALLLALVHCINYQMSTLYFGAAAVPV